MATRISADRAVRTLAVAVVILSLGGVAFAAPNGDSARGSFSFTPSKVPKKRFKPGRLAFDGAIHYANPGNSNAGGALREVQLYFDDDFKFDPKAVPKCSVAQISGNVTMSQAMAACGSSKIGSGTVDSLGVGGGDVPVCALLFNGKAQKGRPSVLLLARAFLSTPRDCSDPAHNDGGQVSVQFIGVLRAARGDYGTVLDFDHIDSISPIPLTSYDVALQRKGYLGARCHDRNRTWNMRMKFTYNDAESDTVNAHQRCRRS